MKKYIANILFLGLIILTGCVSSQTDHERKALFHSCKIQCMNQFQHCGQVCDNSCGHCVSSSKHRAVRNYQHYLQQQSLQGKEIPRELKSYRDPLQCRKITCNCIADLEQCTQLCTGTIHKHLQVAPACC